MNMKPLKYFLAPLLAVLLLTACSDDNDKATLNIRLTDGPGLYDKVYVDIQFVEITGDGGNAVTLNTKSGIYDLLDFSNGLDTLIATGGLEPGTIQQIRLILGNSNTVVVNGQSYPLATPSADQTGLKLQVHQKLEAGVAYSILLDFDANKSVIETGNNEYKLKPVIRTIDQAISGSIKAAVLPSGVQVVIEASSGNNSYSTTANADGKFIIQGLPAGKYDLKITPAAPYNVKSINNIDVTVGVTTDLGNISL